jgi:hypothetical protein
LGSLLTTVGHRSRPGPGDHLRVPKLTINRRCLRQASAPGWPRAGPKGGGPPAAQVSRHVRSEGVADQGQGSMSFSRRALHMDPCPWPALRQSRRRDGIPTHAHSCPVAGRRTSHVRRSCLVPLACPFSRGFTGIHGDPRTPTVRISLTVHQRTSLLTDRYGPLLCKAALWNSRYRSKIRPSPGRQALGRREKP